MVLAMSIPKNEKKAASGRKGGLKIKRRFKSKKAMSAYFSSLSKSRKTHAGGRPKTKV
jgi:hypothetical protein